MQSVIGTPFELLIIDHMITVRTVYFSKGITVLEKYDEQSEKWIEIAWDIEGCGLSNPSRRKK